MEINRKKNIIRIKRVTIIFSLVLILLGSNYIWYKTLKKEHTKLTHALIPPLTNDYYLKQISLTNYQKFSVIEEESLEQKEKKESIHWQVSAPKISQNPKYPNGCEAASAVMLLNYYGIEITLEEFINNYLIKEKVYEKDGKRYGPNPADYYAGDPENEKRGWGCFEPVIAHSIQKVIKDRKKENIETYIIRSDGKEALSSYATFSTPFMIWTTINYEEVQEIYEWFSYDSQYTYTYPKNSHTVLITGVDENYYYVNDPLKEEKNIPIKKEQLEKSFDSMGRQMIFLGHYMLEQE